MQGALRLDLLLFHHKHKHTCSPQRTHLRCKGREHLKLRGAPGHRKKCSSGAATRASGSGGTPSRVEVPPDVQQGSSDAKNDMKFSAATVVENRFATEASLFHVMITHLVVGETQQHLMQSGVSRQLAAYLGA